MKIHWNKVTWYSKLGAVVLFIGVIPVLAFYLGIQYQLTVQSIHEESNVISSTPFAR